jgi:hypothetical protein
LIALASSRSRSGVPNAASMPPSAVVNRDPHDAGARRDHRRPVDDLSELHRRLDRARIEAPGAARFGAADFAA